MGAISQVMAPTPNITSTASGQPSSSSTRQAPDHCSCSGMACSVGMAHIQGSTTRMASRGVSNAGARRWPSAFSGPPASWRHGRVVRASTNAAAARADSSSMATTAVGSQKQGQGSSHGAVQAGAVQAGGPGRFRRRPLPFVLVLALWPGPTARPGCAAHRAPVARGPWGRAVRVRCGFFRCRPV